MNTLKTGILAITSAAALLVACATTQKEEKKEELQASSELIYEDAEGTPADANDPWAGCQASRQQGAIILSCGEITSVYVPVQVAASPQMVEANFKQFDASFPPEGRRERFTQTVGTQEAQGYRVSEASEVAPYRAELIILPTGESSSLVISCVVRGSTDFTRCAKVTEALATSGVPDTIPGAENLTTPSAPEAGASDAGP